MVNQESTIRHPLPECEHAFGKLEAGQEAALKQVDRLHREVTKLTGNGHRGRIDDLVAGQAEMRAWASAIDGRFDRLERFIDKTERRVWSLAAKVAGVVGTVGILTTILVAFFI